MVVIFFAVACETGVEQERTGAPSTWTVHAPHRPAPQPNFVPVSSSVSRRTQSRGVSGATSTFRSLPLMRRVMAAMVRRRRYGQHRTQPARKREMVREERWFVGGDRIRAKSELKLSSRYFALFSNSLNILSPI